MNRVSIMNINVKIDLCFYSALFCNQKRPKILLCSLMAADEQALAIIHFVSNLHEIRQELISKENLLAAPGA